MRTKGFKKPPKFRKHKVLKAELKGGGGAAGKVGFPSYMETFHTAMLGSYSGTTLGTLMAAMISGNSPYEGESAYNPDTALTANQTRYSTYDAALTAFVPNTDWQTAVGVSQAKLDDGTTYAKIDLVTNDMAANAIANAIAAATAALSSTAISDQVDAYETRVVPRFLRSVNRFAAGLADIGAVNSSAFIVGMALLESEVNADVNKFDADISAQAFNEIAAGGIKATFQAAATQRQQRNLYLAEATNLLMQALQQKIQLQAEATRLQSELNRVKIVAKQEETDRNLEIAVQDTFFDLSVLAQGMSVVGGLTGASYIPDKPSKAQSAIGGAISGVATGAAIGSAVPGIGTVAGAVVGGIGGLLSGIF